MSLVEHSLTEHQQKGMFFGFFINMYFMSEGK